MKLSPESEAVVRATAGVVAAHAEEITKVFYPAMFAAHPELHACRPTLPHEIAHERQHGCREGIVTFAQMGIAAIAGEEELQEVVAAHGNEVHLAQQAR